MVNWYKNIQIQLRISQKIGLACLAIVLYLPLTLQAQPTAQPTKSASDILDKAINLSGAPEANSVSTTDGGIVLSPKQGGDNTVVIKPSNKDIKKEKEKPTSLINTPSKSLSYCFFQVPPILITHPFYSQQMIPSVRLDPRFRGDDSVKLWPSVIDANLLDKCFIPGQINLQLKVSIINKKQ